MFTYLRLYDLFILPEILFLRVHLELTVSLDIESLRIAFRAFSAYGNISVQYSVQKPKDALQTLDFETLQTLDSNILNIQLSCFYLHPAVV